MSAEPYVGPRPFTLQDRTRFFGRKDEVDETVSFVIAHPVVLIYALSGVGKSSLVNAGVVPMLREEGYAVLPPTRVEGVVPEGLRAAEITNPFVFHALACWLDVQEVPFCAAEEVAGLRIADFVDQWLQARSGENVESSPVLVFDQFEEIFTSNESRWKERDDFFAQMGEAVRRHPSLKVVFTMREEFIARLEPFAKYFPRQFRIRKRLERLRGEAALAAITRPVEKFGVRFEPGVAEKLVSDLLGVRNEEGNAIPGEYVEPVQLQVVCRNLWEKLPEEIRDGTIGGRLRVITPAHLAAAGETTTALSNYYADAITAAVAASETNEGRLRRWFGETLIAGDHSSLGLAVKGQGETARIPEAALAVLQSRYLIRHEKRGAAEWYELSHARFIEPIITSNAKWLEKRSGADAMRQKLLKRVQELKNAGGIFEEWELREAEAYLASPEAADLGGRAPLYNLMQRSQAAYAQQAKRRKQVRTMTVVLIVASLFAWYSFWKATQSSRTATAQEIALRAVDEIPRDPEVALLLSLDSAKLKTTRAGVSALRRSLVASSVRLRFGDQEGLEKSLTSVAYSPDGRFIVTGGVDHRVRLWDAAHGEDLGIIGAEADWHRDGVMSVAFSPDGRTLASSGSDGSVRLWTFPKPDGAPWPAPRVLEHREADKPTPVRRVAFDATGARLIACCHNGTASLWDVAAGVEVLRLKGHLDESGMISPGRSFVRGASFHPTQNIVLTAGVDGRILFWDLAAAQSAGAATAPAPILEQPLAAVKLEDSSDPALWDVSFNRTGTRFVTAGADHSVRIWDFATRVEIANLDGHSGAVMQARFVDALHLVSVSVDKTARVWTLLEKTVNTLQLPPGGTPAVVKTERLHADSVDVIRGHTDYLRAVDVSPDGEHLVTTSRDGTARVWRTPPLCETGLLRCRAIVWDLAFSPDGQRVVTAASETPVVWSVTGPTMEKPVLELKGHTATVKSVAFHPGGTQIATADRRYNVKLWDAQSGAELRTLSTRLATIAFSPDGNFLAGGTGGKEALIVALADQSTVALRGHNERVMSAAFSRDGERVVTASLDFTAKVWDRATGNLLASLPPKTSDYPEARDNDILLDAAFTPDGSAVATACGNGNITLWELSSRKQLALLKGHEGQVRRLSFFHHFPENPVSTAERNDGRLALLSTGFDSTARIWEKDPQTGAWIEVDRFSPNNDPERSMIGYAASCSPDATQIVTGGEDGIARLYYRDPSWLFGLAAERVTRQLSDEERKAFDIGRRR